jgi:hypothetical protein
MMKLFTGTVKQRNPIKYNFKSTFHYNKDNTFTATCVKLSHVTLSSEFWTQSADTLKVYYYWFLASVTTVSTT